MEDPFNSAINHLEQLVSFDTSNPPRAISESGLLDYLESIAGHNLSITDHGNGSFNCLIQQGNPKHLINVHTWIPFQQEMVGKQILLNYTKKMMLFVDLEHVISRELQQHFYR